MSLETARLAKLSLDATTMILQDTNGTRTWEYVVFATCGAFSIAACLLAFFLIYRHLKHFTEPKPQTNICRILLMVPIYSIDSWLSIYYRHYSVYFDIIRDAYEVRDYCIFFLYRAHPRLTCCTNSSISLSTTSRHSVAATMVRNSRASLWGRSLLTSRPPSTPGPLAASALASFLVRRWTERDYCFAASGLRDKNCENSFSHLQGLTIF